MIISPTISIKKQIFLKVYWPLVSCEDIDECELIGLLIYETVLRRWKRLLTQVYVGCLNERLADGQNTISQKNSWAQKIS